jgi:hypothetical protein
LDVLLVLLFFLLFRTDYTCHQCYYNTNCSRAFEYHLHGHLVSKRTALWNKSLKNQYEKYECPCGFTIDSQLKVKNSDNQLTINNNKLDFDIGNKIADHLINCEYKYCNITTVVDNE